MNRRQAKAFRKKIMTAIHADFFALQAANVGMFDDTWFSKLERIEAFAHTAVYLSYPGTNSTFVPLT